MIVDRKKQKNTGFTLAEIMVSVAIFSVIMVTGMGALVSMTQKLRVSQQEKKVVDSLDFVLESMVREIRLGTNYSAQGNNLNDCSGVNDNTVSYQNPGSNNEGSLILFKASDERGCMIYYYDRGQLIKQTKKEDDDGRKEILTDKTQLLIEKIRMTIMNTERGDKKQPMVWIQILAYSPDRPDSKKIVQTLVSQRVLDYPQP